MKLKEILLLQGQARNYVSNQGAESLNTACWLSWTVLPTVNMRIFILLINTVCVRELTGAFCRWSRPSSGRELHLPTVPGGNIGGRFLVISAVCFHTNLQPEQVRKQLKLSSFSSQKLCLSVMWCSADYREINVMSWSCATSVKKLSNHLELVFILLFLFVYLLPFYQ